MESSCFKVLVCNWVFVFWIYWTVRFPGKTAVLATKVSQYSQLSAMQQSQHLTPHSNPSMAASTLIGSGGVIYGSSMSTEKAGTASVHSTQQAAGEMQNGTTAGGGNNFRFDGTFTISILINKCGGALPFKWLVCDIMRIFMSVIHPHFRLFFFLFMLFLDNYVKFTFNVHTLNVKKSHF